MIKNAVMVMEKTDKETKKINEFFYPCKVNTETKEIFNINIDSMFANINEWFLRDEYLVFDGEIHGATGTSNDWKTDEDYLYDDM